MWYPYDSNGFWITWLWKVYFTTQWSSLISSTDTKRGSCTIGTTRIWNFVIGSHHQPWYFAPCELSQHRISAYQCTSPMELATSTAWSKHRIRRGLFYGELLCGRRHQGRPEKHYKGAIKTNLPRCRIRPNEFEECAADRLRWRAIVPQISANCEEARRQKNNIQREQNHCLTLSLVTTTDFQVSSLL